MNNVIVEYTYNGDEEHWQKVISTFINYIEADDRLNG